MIIFEMKNLKSDESPPSSFGQILANFANQSPPSLLKRMILGHRSNVLVLEIAAYLQRIHFYLVSENHLKSYFESQLTSFYPKSHIEPVQEYMEKVVSPKFKSFAQMVLTREFLYPLATHKTIRDTDPLARLLFLFSKLSHH